jgi:integrase
MAEHHELMGGKLHLYKRENSRHWQCSAYLAGKNRRKTTKEESLSHAKEIAEDWYLELRGKARAGGLGSGPSFKKVADQFLLEYENITQGERSERWVKSYEWRLRVHVLPFLGPLPISEVTAGKVQEYRVYRKQKAMEKWGKPPGRTTVHHEIVTIRQVLKTALRHGSLKALPDLSSPYKTSGKVEHRAWFSPEEYDALIKAARQRARTPLNNRHRWACEQFLDYVLFMANTGLRPDEASRLEFRDIKIEKDPATKQTILEISVRGKRGTGWCKSTSNAVLPFTRLRDRKRKKVLMEDGKRKIVEALPESTDRVFPLKQRELFNAILSELGLKKDRDGKSRTAYSLRHTYICFRLMEGANIYQVANNCRTSVEMIEKFYARHLKDRLDASEINVTKGTFRRRRRAKANNKKHTNGGAQ